jgi:hypothetical protein
VRVYKQNNIDWVHLLFPRLYVGVYTWGTVNEPNLYYFVCKPSHITWGTVNEPNLYYFVCKPSHITWGTVNEII